MKQAKLQTRNGRIVVSDEQHHAGRVGRRELRHDPGCGLETRSFCVIHEEGGAG